MGRWKLFMGLGICLFILLGCSVKSYKEQFLELTQTRDYKKALDISQKACAEGVAEACRNVGDFYENGLGTDRELTKTQSFYSRACELADALSCASLGRFYYDGVGVSKDYKQSAWFYQRACDLGHNLSCIKTSNLNAQENVRISTKERIAYLYGACASQNALACYNLSYLRQNAQDDLDYLSIAQGYLRACELSYGRACVRLGEIYSMGVELPQKDFMSKREAYDRAYRLLKESCEAKEAQSCIEVAKMYEYGNGVHKDLNWAMEYRKMACNMGNISQCLIVGDYYLYGLAPTQDFLEAESYYQKVCKAGNGSGCERLGYLYFFGKGVKKNRDKGVGFYQKACKLGNAFACYQSKFIFNKRFKRSTKQKDIPQDACEMRTKEACYEIGLVYEYGIGVPVDTARAKRYYKASCDYGYIFACTKSDEL